MKKFTNPVSIYTLLFLLSFQQVLAADDLAAERLEISGQQVQQRGLPAAVRTGETDAVTGIDGKRGALK